MSQRLYHVRNNVLVTSLCLGLSALAARRLRFGHRACPRDNCRNGHGLCGTAGNHPRHCPNCASRFTSTITLWSASCLTSPCLGQGTTMMRWWNSTSGLLQQDSRGRLTILQSRGFGAISFFGPFNRYRNFTAENLQHLAFDVRSMDQSIVAGLRSPPHWM